MLDKFPTEITKIIINELDVPSAFNMALVAKFGQMWKGYSSLTQVLRIFSEDIKILERYGKHVMKVRLCSIELTESQILVIKHINALVIEQLNKISFDQFTNLHKLYIYNCHWINDEAIDSIKIDYLLRLNILPCPNVSKNSLARLMSIYCLTLYKMAGNQAFCKFGNIVAWNDDVCYKLFDISNETPNTMFSGLKSPIVLNFVHERMRPYTICAKLRPIEAQMASNGPKGAICCADEALIGQIWDNIWTKKDK
jgi:hypothetical protein